MATDFYEYVRALSTNYAHKGEADAMTFLKQRRISQPPEKQSSDFFSENKGLLFPEDAGRIDWPNGNVTVLPWIIEGQGINYVSNSSC